MTSNDIRRAMRAQGRADALGLAARAPQMDGTAIIAEESKIPAWSENAVYTSKQVGYPVQDNGQVYTILMPHTPAHNPGSRPADLRAIYSLLHTTDLPRQSPGCPAMAPVACTSSTRSVLIPMPRAWNTSGATSGIITNSLL